MIRHWFLQCLLRWVTNSEHELLQGKFLKGASIKIEVLRAIHRVKMPIGGLVLVP